MFGQVRIMRCLLVRRTFLSSLPLHPAIVHVPLGLAFILPALALGFGWALWTGRVRPRAWLAIVALQATLVGAGWLAMNTGEREEDRVEKVVPSAAISTHEEYAEQFVWAAGATLLLAALVPALRRQRLVRGVALASVAGTFVVAGMAIRVGHAGGQLVYTHNAGSAYASASRAAASPAGTARPDSSVERQRHGDDDDDR
jgi:uncharacterized membrane protein